MPSPGQGLNQKVAEADDFLTVLVSRDTRCLFYIPAVAAPWKGTHIEGARVTKLFDIGLTLRQSMLSNERFQ